MSLIQLLLSTLVTSVRLLKVCNVLDSITVKISGDLSQVTEGLYCPCSG